MEKPIRNDSKLVLNIELKDALAKKMRLRVWGYSMDKYLYMLAGSRLTLKHKTYAITTEDDLEERKQMGRFLGAIAAPIIGGLVDKKFKKEE